MTPEDQDRSIAQRVALGMYADEPCRICGELLTQHDLSTGVFAGYSADNKSRAAHKACWDKHLPKDQWTYPE